MNKCCFIAPEFQDKPEDSPWCENPCNWEIHDLDDQDPHSNDTYSCDKHLVDLLQNNNSVTFIGERNG